MSDVTFHNMVGKTMISVSGAVRGASLIFIANDGAIFWFTHHQDCCEGVSIEDICGDLEDLVGSPMILAEEVSNLPHPPAPEHHDASTQWTFYRFGTAKGTVTVRWFGESNGYYSTDVSYEEKLPAVYYSPSS